MDLIKKMAERRVILGVTSTAPAASTAKQHQEMAKAGKSLSARKKEIIENTPKAKIVKEYFEDLIAELEADTSDED
jgi:hypothetical protein